ncbi:helix-turn-helix domain-containing protein [Eisenbergiella porci]|uniref:helix-turn-helix domain-containing protein n=1 Tax=Eisenbergiella porci TaxID=2652274 RepID=UPI003FA46B2A
MSQHTAGRHHTGAGISYASHTFKASTGCSFREYINLLRMEKAKKLLANTSFSSDERNAAVGISEGI